MILYRAASGPVISSLLFSSLLLSSSAAELILCCFSRRHTFDIPHRPYTALGGYECVLASVLMDNLSVAYAAATDVDNTIGIEAVKIGV